MCKRIIKFSFLLKEKVPIMPRFFVDNGQIENGVVTVIGHDAHHISRSLRMAVGDQIVVCDTERNEYLCVLKEFLPDRVTASVISYQQSAAEPPFRVRLYQALPKGDKLDVIIQKAVESGVFSITTFQSERCIAKDKLGDETRVQRRNRIALEAAKQSGRGYVPHVFETVTFEKMLEEASLADIPLICYEGEETCSVKKVFSEKRASLSDGCIPEISVVIGSEGGFSASEVEAARRAGLIPVGLGKRILRTETASGFVLGCLCYEFEL